MGSGIAQAASQAGYKVSMMDTSQELVDAGMGKIKKMLNKGVERGKIKPEKVEEVLSKIKVTTEIKVAVENAELVIEAVFEDIEVKKKLFSELKEFCKPEAIIASNTSSLGINKMAEFTEFPGKFGGLHFFNPAAINKLIEVVRGEKTSHETFDALMNFSRRLGKIPLEIKDSPGFAVNRFFVPFLNESCRMLEEGVANKATIEEAAKRGFKIGMGPFALMNFTGIPIAYHAENTLYEGLGEFYRPSEALKSQFEAGKPWEFEGEEVDESKIEAVQKRLFGTTWGIACHLVEEGVASKEDTDRGALLGLRWAQGPFEMMNSYGINDACKVVQGFALSTDGKFNMSESLLDQARMKQPWQMSTVKLSKQDRFGLITMCRPEALNALNTKVLSDLDNVITRIKEDDDIGVVIITGEGNSFVAGADIKEMMEKSPMAAREFTRYGQQVLKRLEDLDKPVIAAVNGFALGGGCELALACDMIIASEKAKLGLPEVSLGIHPGFGGTQRLPRLIGRAKAKELIFTGDMIPAKEAERIGLVNKTVPSDQLITECKDLGARILARGPVAVRLAKSAINRGGEMTLDDGLAYEIETVSLAFSTEDKSEGMDAFISKRKPDFKGK
ncbi:MAG: enoyl-CoA hydratase/isomerase family protein [Thermoplasmata archaeon]|nr:MAG: enoyl-CoA hydratase/isomerase family protein [Thermoplasmata archaeon]